MALGFGNKDAASTPPPATHPYDDQKPTEKDGYDTERQGSRRMSRIDKPAVSSDDESMDIGTQIEMEKDNAIKYRTCSWQKV